MNKQKVDETDKEIVRRINSVKKLLRQFDVEAYAFDPGVRCFVKGHRDKYIDFDGSTWEFIEPLLRELIKWRKYGEKFNIFMCKSERKKYETSSKRS